MEIHRTSLSDSAIKDKTHFLSKHFEIGASRGPVIYGIQMGLESSIFSLCIIFFMSLLGIKNESTLLAEISSDPISKLIFLSLIVAPISETIFLQFLPISIAGKFTTNRRALLLAGVISFTLLHISNGPIGIVAAGLVGGFFFSAVFVEFRESSIFKAIWATTLSHFVHNLLSVGSVLIFNNN